MTIELYAFPLSPRGFKVMAVANHLGLDWTLRFVDLRKGEQRSPEFAALNPNMRMPVLKDGEYVLWESSAIVQYLALRRPEAGLFPADERARLDIARWQFWDHAHWDAACSIFAFERVVKPALFGINEADPAEIAKGTERFHRAAKVLNEQLRGRRYITGPNLTIADFGIGSALNLVEPAQYPIEPYGEIKRWYADLCALPAWQQTLAQCAAPTAAAA